MTAKASIVDYGRGNLLSVARGLEYCGADVKLVATAPEIDASNYLVLPGVGAFGDAMAQLERQGLIDSLVAYQGTGRPFLGICVGMQVLFDHGEEFGDHRGLGLLSGTVKAIPNTDGNGKPHKIPHIGWNELRPRHAELGWKDSLLSNITASSSVYYVHSYAAVPYDQDVVLATSDYNGRSICGVVRKDNMYGCQFHPEKSGEVGLKILEGFMAL